MSTGHNPYQAPQTPLATAEMAYADGGRPLATLGQRFLGWLLDVLILAIPYYIINRVVVSMIGNPPPVIDPNDPMSAFRAAFEGPGLMASTVVGILSILLYCVVNFKFLQQNGQSIGKKIIGTKIVTLDQQLPPLSVSLGKRYLIMCVIQMIPFINLIVGLVSIVLVFVDKERRMVHDYIAGTKVVQA